MVKGKMPDKPKSKLKGRAEPKKPAVKAVCPGKSVSVLSSCCCCECGELVGDESKALRCEKCTVETWKCASCLGLTDELYDELTTHASNGLHWFCTKCEEVVFEGSVTEEKIANTLDKLDTKTDAFEQRMQETLAQFEHQLTLKISDMEKMIEKKAGTDLLQAVDDRLKKLEERPSIIEEAQQRIEHKVDMLKSNMNEPMVQAVQGALQGALQEDKCEEAEIEQRKKNVIVHGVAESQVDNPEQRIDDDLQVLAAMFHEVGVDDVQVDSVTRLGKKSSDSTQNPRPMKVVLNSVEGKINVLKRAKNLREKQEGGWTRVFIHQDLTPKQREARKPLVAELKLRKANGETDITIFNGKIVKKRGTPLVVTN